MPPTRPDDSGPLYDIGLLGVWQRYSYDDTWVLRVVGLPAPRPGQVIPVRKSSGEITHETVSEIIWTSGALTICRHVPKQYGEDWEE